MGLLSAVCSFLFSKVNSNGWFGLLNGVYTCLHCEFNNGGWFGLLTGVCYFFYVYSLDYVVNVAVI